ncbi:hypothetical protein P3W85_09985 [Cupriavidus basilensis]|uniref:Lipoprotein n=1 Tax=Cupriavidus basilensis TaxID=68895 RepID=A0ABT6AKY4_9BURK|nr:hypothetical protein [Cupriavidus basilensis]MDF3833273.1 hypothetical protein [Cupriavidus basilensis]
MGIFMRLTPSYPAFLLISVIALSACDQKAVSRSPFDEPLQAFVAKHTQLCVVAGPSSYSYDTWPNQVDVRYFTDKHWDEWNNAGDRLNALAAAGLIEYVNGPNQGFRTYSLTDLGRQKLRKNDAPRPGSEAKGDEGRLCFGTQKYRGVVGSEEAPDFFGYEAKMVKYKVDVTIETWARRQDVQAAFEQIKEYGAGGIREKSRQLLRREDGWIIPAP